MSESGSARESSGTQEFSRTAPDLPGDRDEFSRNEAASRITAFVYGNILVMAAMVALHPDDLESLTGVAYVLGTALSTYVAHVTAESVGDRVRHDVRPDRSTVVHELRGAVPILSSAVLPALSMLTALLGWLGTTVALQLAMATTVVRLAGFGWATGHVLQNRASWRTFLAGILLAVVCVAAAVLKWWLTH